MSTRIGVKGRVAGESGFGVTNIGGTARIVHQSGQMQNVVLNGDGDLRPSEGHADVRAESVSPSMRAGEFPRALKVLLAVVSVWRDFGHIAHESLGGLPDL